MQQVNIKTISDSDYEKLYEILDNTLRVSDIDIYVSDLYETEESYFKPIYEDNSINGYEFLISKKDLTLIK